MSFRNSSLYLKKDAVPRLDDQGRPLFQKVVYPVLQNPSLLDPLPCFDCQFIHGEEQYGHESNDRQSEVKTKPSLRPLGYFFPVGVGCIVMWFDGDKIVCALFSTTKWFFA